MRRIAWLALALTAAAGCSKGLGAKDVELTINTLAAAVSDADVATVTALELTLSGNQHDHTRYDLTRALSRKETLVVHLTTSTGDLTVGVLARDAQGLVVAAGNTKSTLAGSDPHLVAVDLELPPDGPHAMSAVGLHPDHAQLFAGQTMALASPSAVTWAVTPGGAGGTIDDSGVYTAPASAGSDEVTATSTVYFGETRTTTVDVLASGVLRWAGLPDGAGTLDGVGAAARVADVQGLAFDGAGHAWFSDGSNVVRRLDIASGAVTTIAGTVENNIVADGTGSGAGFGNPWGVAWDGARGALYVSDSNSMIRKIVVPSGAVTTLAGQPWTGGSVDANGTAARFANIWGLAFDGNKTLYVADAGNNQVRAVDVTTGDVTTIAGTTTAGYKDGAGATAQFSFPTCIALDGAGHAFVGDNNQLVRRIDLATNMVSTLAGKLNVSGFTDGPPGVGTLNYPNQLAYADGALYIPGRTLDVATGTVKTLSMDNWAPISALAFAPDGTLWMGGPTVISTVNRQSFDLTPVAGTPRSNSDVDRVDGDRSTARLNDPVGVTMAHDGTMLVRDGSSVRKIDVAAGTVKALYSGAYLGGSGNLVADSNGDIYFTSSSAIYRLLASEGLAAPHVYAGAPNTWGYMDGPVATARFAGPSDLVLVGKTLYIPDTGNDVIRAIDLSSGMVSTPAGTANMGGLVDMPGAAARFNGPQGITTDGNGALYVVSNNAVRKIVIAGAVVSTIAGGDLPGFADGNGSAAKLNAPIKIAWDKGRSVLFVGDLKNTAIREVTLGGDVTTVAGAPGKPYLVPGPLPAALNEPTALTVGPGGDLFVVVYREESLVQIRLP